MDKNVKVERTGFFKKQLNKLKVSEKEIKKFENQLAEQPTTWPVITKTGGCRKARMEHAGKGKSGGLRIIYIYIKIDGVIYMLYAYQKGKKDTLTDADKKALQKAAQLFKSK